jgi:phage-related protein
MQRKKLITHFYISETNEEPVRKWLLELSKEDRFIIGVDIKTIEYGWPIGMPVCKPLGDKLYEIRSSISGRRITRLLFCIKGSHIILLHGFIKKTQKTPLKELEIAKKRMRKIENEK